MTKTLSEGREMFTAEEVHEITGAPISTLHDWAAKRERERRLRGPTISGLVIGIDGGRGTMLTNGSNPPESDPPCRYAEIAQRQSQSRCLEPWRGSHTEDEPTGADRVD